MPPPYLLQLNLHSHRQLQTAQREEVALAERLQIVQARQKRAMKSAKQAMQRRAARDAAAKASLRDEVQELHAQLTVRKQQGEDAQKKAVSLRRPGLSSPPLTARCRQSTILCAHALRRTLERARTPADT